jgi:hypothetical protein
MDMVFEVVGRAKTEKVNKGKREITYRVSFKSNDGHHRLVLTDNSSAILEKYPFGSIVNVNVGQDPQTKLPEEKP